MAPARLATLAAFVLSLTYTNAQATLESASVVGILGKTVSLKACGYADNGQYYLTGMTAGNVDGAFTSSSVKGIYIQSYNDTGGRLWTIGTEASNWAYPVGIETDSANNGIMAGYSSYMYDGVTKVTTGTDSQGLITKVSPTGTKLWSKCYGSMGSRTNVNSVAIDSQDNIILCGIVYTQGGPFYTHTVVGSGDAFILKLNSTGHVQWVYAVGESSGDSHCYDVAVDGNDDIHWVGGTRANTFATKTGSWDCIQAKVSSSGSLLWSYQNGYNSKVTRCFGVTADADGTNYVAAEAYVTFDGVYISSSSSYTQAACLRKRNSAGTRLYSKCKKVTGKYLYGYHLASDKEGYLYQSGQTNTGLDGSAYTGFKSWFTMKWRKSDGVQIGSADVITAGVSGFSANLDGDVCTPKNKGGEYTLALNSDGEPLGYNGPNPSVHPGRVTEHFGFRFSSPNPTGNPTGTPTQVPTVSPTMHPTMTPSVSPATTAPTPFCPNIYTQFGTFSSGEKYKSCFPVGNIAYCPPSGQDSVMKIDAITNTVSYMSEQYIYSGTDNYKWADACVVMGTNIYCAPWSNSKVLKIDTVADTSVELSETYSAYNYQYDFCYALGTDIYCPPYYPNKFLKIDTTADTSSLVGPDLGTTTQKFRICGKIGNAIYCPPYFQQQIMKIDTNGTFTQLTNLGSGNAKYRACAVVGTNMWCAPYNEGKSLKIDSTTDTGATFGTTYSGYSKYAACAAAGTNVFCPPYGTAVTRTLKIDTIAGTTGLVGPTISGNYKFTVAQSFWGDVIAPAGRSGQMLMIDGITGAITYVGPSGLPTNAYLGYCAQIGNALFCAPTAALEVQKIEVCLPTSAPTASPTTSPTMTISPTTSAPTTSPVTVSPTTSAPTTSPVTVSPTTSAPTANPTSAPTNSPVTTSPTTSQPTAAPTTSPVTVSPITSAPITSAPTTSPVTVSPITSAPTANPTSAPTTSPVTTSPTTSQPTAVPSSHPFTATPTLSPTTSPTSSPTWSPTSRSPTTLGPTTRGPTFSPTTRSPITTHPTRSPSTRSPTSGGGVTVALSTVFTFSHQYISTRLLMPEFRRQYKMCAARAARVAASQVIIDSVVPGSTIVSARVLLGSEPAAIHFVQAAIFPRRVWNFTYGFNETQFSQPLRCSAELVIDEEDNEAGIPIIAIYVGIAVIACLVLAALGFAIYHCGQRNARYSVKDSKKNVIAQNQPRNNETIELEAVDVMTMTGGKAGRL